MQTPYTLLITYPDRLGIGTSHYLMDTNPGNNLGSYGQDIYDALSDNPNLFMMLAGHWYGEAWQTATAGRTGMQPVLSFSTTACGSKATSTPMRRPGTEARIWSVSMARRIP